MQHREEFIRTFIAIELSPKVRDYIRKTQNIFKKKTNQVRWIKPENCHLTLKFLGTTNISSIKNITDVIMTQKSQHLPLNLDIAELGAFPRLTSPRIIWISAHDKENKIQEIVFNLENALSPIGFKKEKREFKPHITLGRIKSNKKIPDLSRVIEKHQVNSQLQQPVESISLIKSTLTPQGSIYETLFVS